MKQQKRLEDILKKRFEDARAEPSPSLKERIFGKSNHSFLYLISGIAASVVIVLLVLFLVTNKNTEPAVAENDKPVNNVPESNDTLEIKNKSAEPELKEHPITNPEEKSKKDKVKIPSEGSVEWKNIAAIDNVKEFELPDGSMVYLNKNSEISYTDNFSQQRALKLSGEAFFEVKSDKNNPFVLEAGQTNVKVLGTSFNVVVQENQLVSLHTFSGLVAVSTGSNDVIELSAGESATIENGKLLKQKFEDQNIISWKTNQLIFEQSELSNVFQDLENYFHVSIRYDGQIPSCKYTGTFNDPELSKILQVITTVTGLKYNETGTGIIFYGECK